MFTVNDRETVEGSVYYMYTKDQLLVGRKNRAYVFHMGEQLSKIHMLASVCRLSK